MNAPPSLSATEAQQRQTAAWEAYQATVRAIAASPALATNPFYTALRDTAYARFRAEYEA